MKTPLFSIIFLLLSVSGFSQNLTFRNPVLVSGIAGQDSAKYRFSNVTLGIDAYVKIMGRNITNPNSNNPAEIILQSIDDTVDGYDIAFQPMMGLNGMVPQGREWYIEYEVQFVLAGTNTPVFANLEIMTIDLDGDRKNIGQKGLIEWSHMYELSQPPILRPGSWLTFASTGCGGIGCDYRIESITVGIDKIDTFAVNAKKVIAHFNYINKNKIHFRLGSNTSSVPNGGNSTTAMRMNSLFFSRFNIVTILPVNFIKIEVTLSHK